MTFSQDYVTAEEMFGKVLADLASRKRPAFCTFEATYDPKIWLQVDGAELSQGAFAWISPGDPMPRLRQLGVPVLPGMTILENQAFSGKQVVLFSCDPARAEEWAKFIDAFFRRVHGLSEEHHVKGWVTRAD